MSTAIHMLKNVPSEDLLKKENIRIFLITVLAAIAYLHEHDETEKFQEIQAEWESKLGDMSGFQSELELRFFQDLYVDRVERTEVQNMIRLKKFVLLHGLVGSGKSTILRKVKKDFESNQKIKFSYFDLAAATQELRPDENDGFLDRLKDYLFNELYDQYIQPSDLSNRWDIFVIREDENYSHIKVKVNSIMRRVISSEKDWADAYQNKEIRQMFIQTQKRPELITLLRFLRSQFEYVLCFDNVDRYRLAPQRDLITFCSDLDKSRNLKIGIFLAIRETNLRRLRSEAVKSRESKDDLAYLQFQNYLERLDAGLEKELRLGALSRYSVQALLEQRMSFLRTHKDYHAVYDFLDEFLKSLPSNDDGLPVNANEFDLRFWKIFEIIADTFVDADMYRLCNHSVREMLRIYFLFINHLMLNTEDEYTIKKIFLDDRQVRITKLRNFFYKFVICKGNLLPGENTAFPNIFNPSQGKLGMLDLKVLLYCNNFEEAHQDQRLHFSKMKDDFALFGVSDNLLKERLLFLLRPQGIEEMGFILLDGSDDLAINDDTPIQLQPSGQYFVETISTSREYAFWSALSADLPISILEKPVEYKQTYSDELKYEVVSTLIQNRLLRCMETEFEYFSNNLFPPDEYQGGSNVGYLLSLFGFGGKCYVTRLINSVKATIEYSNMSPYKKTKYSRIFFSLKRQSQEIIRKYITAYSS